MKKKLLSLVLSGAMTACLYAPASAQSKAGAAAGTKIGRAHV